MDAVAASLTDDGSESSSTSQGEPNVLVGLLFGYLCLYLVPMKAFRRLAYYITARKLLSRGTAVHGVITSRRPRHERTHVEFDLTVQYVCVSRSASSSRSSSEGDHQTPATFTHEFAKLRGSGWNRTDRISIWIMPSKPEYPYTNEFVHEFSRKKPLILWMVAWLYTFYVALDVFSHTQGEKESLAAILLAAFTGAVVAWARFFWHKGCFGLKSNSGWRAVNSRSTSASSTTRSALSSLSLSLSLDTDGAGIEMERPPPSPDTALARAASEECTDHGAPRTPWYDDHEVAEETDIETEQLDTSGSTEMQEEIIVEIPPSGRTESTTLREREQQVIPRQASESDSHEQYPKAPERRLFFPAVVLPFRKWHIGPIVLWPGGYLTPRQGLLQLAMVCLPILFLFAVVNANSLVEGFVAALIILTTVAVVVTTFQRLRAMWLVWWKIQMAPDSVRFVSSIKAFLDNRCRMDQMACQVAPTGQLQQLAIPTHSGGIVADDGTYKSEYQQQRQEAGGGSVQDMNELYHAAEKARDVFGDFLAEIAGQVNGIGDPESAVLVAPFKSRGRAKEKAADDYSQRFPGPAISWLYDIVRGCIVCSSEQEIADAAQLVLDKSHVVKVKNRFATPTCSGYRDLIFHIRLPIGAESFHICEVQIHHSSLKELDRQIGSHADYEYLRSYFSGSMDTVEERMGDLEAIASSSRLDPAFVANLLATDEIPRIERLANLFETELQETNLAFALWQRIVELLERSPYGNQMGIAEAYYRMGSLSLTRNNCKAALLFCDKALEAWRVSSVGMSHDLAANAYLTIGRAHARLGDVPMARGYHNRALEIMERLPAGCRSEDEPSSSEILESELQGLLGTNSDIESVEDVEHGVSISPLLRGRPTFAPPESQHTDQGEESCWRSFFYAYVPKLLCLGCLISLVGPYAAGYVFGSLWIPFDIL